MAYVYLNDGGPESEDYASNYFYFDENNLKTLALIEDLLTSNAERDEAFREKLIHLCQLSLNKTEVVEREQRAIGWINKLSKVIRSTFSSYEHAPQCIQN